MNYYGAARSIDHERRQMTIIGKRNKRRVIDLNPFGAYDLLSRPAGLCWQAVAVLAFGRRELQELRESVRGHRRQDRGLGERERRRISAFRFHDLRHWHAVQWLKDGRSIYDLQHRLGHTSIKTTEMYCEYLTSDEQRVAKQQTGTISRHNGRAERQRTSKKTLAAS